MNALQLQDVSSEASAESVPATVCALIACAVATLDTDRDTSRRCLLQASTILQTGAAHVAANDRSARARGGLARWQLNRIVDYIEQHLADRITGTDLTRLIGVSPGQLFRNFKASVGIPPFRYIAARRLELACSLLRTTSDPLCQIALTAGFNDQSHFCRVFRRVLGGTPATWRRENGCDPRPHAASLRDHICVQRTYHLHAVAQGHVAGSV